MNKAKVYEDKFGNKFQHVGTFHDGNDTIYELEDVSSKEIVCISIVQVKSRYTCYSLIRLSGNQTVVELQDVRFIS